MIISLTEVFLTSPKECKNSTIMRTSANVSSVTPQLRKRGRSGRGLLSVNSKSSTGCNNEIFDQLTLNLLPVEIMKFSKPLRSCL